MMLAGHKANRIHGTLQVTLADGREASLEIDIDVSDPRSFLEVQTHYDDFERVGMLLNRPTRALAQTLSIHWPTPPYPLRDPQPEAPLTIRVPV